MKMTRVPTYGVSCKMRVRQHWTHALHSFQCRNLTPVTIQIRWTDRQRDRHDFVYAYIFEVCINNIQKPKAAGTMKTYVQQLTKIGWYPPLINFSHKTARDLHVSW